MAHSSRSHEADLCGGLSGLESIGALRLRGGQRHGRTGCDRTTKDGHAIELRG